jgi:hypothetical protein
MSIPTVKKILWTTTNLLTEGLTDNLRRHSGPRTMEGNCELAELRIMAIAKQFARKGRVCESEGRYGREPN